MLSRPGVKSLDILREACIYSIVRGLQIDTDCSWLSKGILENNWLSMTGVTVAEYSLE